MAAKFHGEFYVGEVKHFVIVHANSDWSGNAVVSARRAGELAVGLTIEMPAQDLLRGVNFPDEMPMGMATRATALAVNYWWGQRAKEAVDNICIPGVL